MKNKIYPSLTVLLLVFVLSGSFTLKAQSTNEEEKKIHVKVVKDVDGEKKVVEKTYNSLEELKADPDFKNATKDLGEEFPHLMLKSDKGDIKIIKKEGSSDGDHHNVKVLKMDGEKGKPMVIETNDGEITIEKTEDGKIKVLKDGKEVDTENLDIEEDIHVINMDSAEGVKVKEWKTKGGKKRKVIMLKQDGDEAVDIEAILEEHGIENIDNKEIKVIHLDGEHKNKKIKVLLEATKVYIKDFEKEDKTLKKLKLKSKANLNLDGLNFYPNPNDGKFKLEFQGEAVPTNIQILDLAGKSVYSENLSGFDGIYKKEIDLSNNKPGVYILRMIQGKKALNKKIIIE